jgi:sulfide dehydrogenase [flavocytochrome c] flavoprotein subunit
MTLGLTDKSGWCPVDRRRLCESTLQPKVHVIGDASIADAMPKSGFSANTQAKVPQHAPSSKNSPAEPPPSRCGRTPATRWQAKTTACLWLTCSSLVEGKIARVNGKSGATCRSTPRPAQIRLGARYQQAWLRTFTQDCFA